MLNRPFTGVIAAPVLPMVDGGDIDWPALEHYIDWIAAQQPDAIVMNVDASEVIALDDDEQLRVIATCKQVLGGRVPLLSGVVAGSTRPAAHKARRLRDYAMKPGDAYLYEPGILHSPRRDGPTRLLRIEGVNMDRVKRLPYQPVDAAA